LEEHPVKREIRDAWIKALRSGEYVQGKNMLHYLDADTGVNHYCCLGVLSELALEAGIVETLPCRLDQMTVFSYFHPLKYTSIDTFDELSQSNLIWTVRDWAKFYNDFQISDLVSLNDAGTDFSVIADYIENYVIVDESE
jgi:hypothetical protein